MLAYPKNADASAYAPTPVPGFHEIGRPERAFAAASSTMSTQTDTTKVSNGAAIDCKVIASSGIPLLI